MKPIEKRLTVPLSPKEAFDLFTARMDLWWPKESHSLMGANAQVTFPTHVGDEIIEEGPDGTRRPWGHLIAYEAGRYLAYAWYPGRTKDEATVVTVTFSATDEGTLLELTHGGFEILGPTADAVSTSYLHGWDLVLGCYASACAPITAL